MKYKIVKYIERSHKLDPETKLYELIEIEKYYALRKGRIFGFWHRIGDWLMDSQGNNFCAHNTFNSILQAASYIKCWHKETYPNDPVCKIDPVVNFK